MIYAERGNRVITIKEESIPKYVEQGYTITDEYGKVIQNTVPTDTLNLKKAYVDHTKEIESLKAENAQLKAQLAELSAKANKKAAEKVEVDAEQTETPVEVAETPKKTRKANKAE